MKDLSVVSSAEMGAVQGLGDLMGRFGFSEQGSWQISCAGGVIDFITSENTTLAVLKEGDYSAGVWETLMIVARELGRF